MLIEVTAEDIRLGKRDHCYLCPIARAVARQLKIPFSRKRVEVTEAFVYLNDPHSFTKMAKLSRRAAKFVKDFDNKKTPQPFKFKLEF